MTFPLRPCGNLGQPTTRAEPRLHAWLRDALSHGYMPGCARHRAQWLTPPQPALPTCAPSRTPSASGSCLYTTQAFVHSVACPDCSLGEVTKPAPPRGPQPRCTASLAGRRSLTQGRDDSRRRSPPPKVRTAPMRPSPEGSRRHTSPLHPTHPECPTQITFTPPRVQGDDV